MFLRGEDFLTPRRRASLEQEMTLHRRHIVIGAVLALGMVSAIALIIKRSPDDADAGGADKPAPMRSCG